MPQKAVLRLPDLEQSKSAVLNSLLLLSCHRGVIAAVSAVRGLGLLPVATASTAAAGPDAAEANALGAACALLSLYEK